MTDLPPGWAWASVGDVADLADGPFGSNLKTAHYVASGPRVVRLQNIGYGVFRDERAHITEEHFQRLVKHAVHAGDLVVASLGEDAPRACLIPPWLGSAIVKADCVRIRPRGGIESAYVMWMLNSAPVRREAAASIKGVGRPRLGLGGIRALTIPVPPLMEQRRIATAIEEHFSRLDAATASLRGAAVRADALVAAATAEALAGDWPVVRLGDVTVKQEYGSSAKASTAGEIAVLRMGNIRDGAIHFRDLKYLAADHPDAARFLLEPGDLLFNRTNSPELVGKSAVFIGADKPVAFASYLIRVRLSNDCLPEWGAFVINSPIGRAYIAQVRTQQVGQANVNGTKLARMSIPLPPVDDQRRLLRQVGEHKDRATHLRDGVARALRRSDLLRRAILARAFRGELVPQDPNDEPASVLLERIAGERPEAERMPTRRRIRSRR